MLDRLERFLKENNIGFKRLIHPEAYTAQEIAASMHVKGQELAKSVIVKANGNYIMTVLPASRRLDLEKLKKALDEKDIRLAKEEEFASLFPDCEPGAEPPFGNLYNVETLVDSSLTKDEHIFFNAGSHYEALEIDFHDFEKTVRPKVADFAEKQ